MLIGTIYYMELLETLSLHDRVEYLRILFRTKSEEIMTEYDSHDIPYGYIYLIITKSDGKSYIGQRKLVCDYHENKGKNKYRARGLRRYLSSGKDVKKHIDSNGEDDIIKMFISYAWSKPDLDAMETSLIRYGKSIGECQMNHAINAPWPNTLEPEVNLGAKAAARKLKIQAEKRYHDEVDGIESIIIENHKLGFSTRDISNEFHISRKHVTRCLKENGFVLRVPLHDYAYTCAYCGKVSHVKTTKESPLPNKYCSHHCANLDKRKFNMDKYPLEELKHLYEDEGMTLSDMEEYYNHEVTFNCLYAKMRAGGVIFRHSGDPGSYSKNKS